MNELGALLAQDVGVSAWLSETATARAGGAAVTFDFPFSADVAGLHFFFYLRLLFVKGRLELEEGLFRYRVWRWCWWFSIRTLCG